MEIKEFGVREGQSPIQIPKVGVRITKPNKKMKTKGSNHHRCCSQDDEKGVSDWSASHQTK